MIKKTIIGISIFLVFSSYGPPNCNIYKDNEPCYKACKEAEKAITHYQGSRKSQIHFDKSIALCPTFDYSYYEKSVPYAKRGLIKEWKKMIDKAVELNPQEHLANRGWYHFFFMHNYEAAIKDIEQLEKISTYNIGQTGDSDYHLNIMKALCFKGLGQSQKAISILNKQLNHKEHYTGLYDYLHLGVLYLENNQIDLALKSFDRQIQENDLSEIYYYKALCMKKSNQFAKHKSYLKKALTYYQKGQSMSNAYRQMVDEIYLSDIEKELAQCNK